MSRLHYDGLGATLDGALDDSDTTITFADALTHNNPFVPTDVETVAAGDYIALSILDDGEVVEVVWLTAYTSGATTGTITRGREGTTAVSHDDGARLGNAPLVYDDVTVPGTDGGISGVNPVDRKKRTSGDIGINSTTFVDVNTSLDLVLPASAGDIVELTLQARVNAGSGTTYVVADFHTIVGGSPVNSVSAESAAGSSLTSSMPNWGAGAAATSPNGALLTGSGLYTVQSDDVSGDTVTFRLRALSGAQVYFLASDPVLYVAAVNLGQIT